MGDEMVDEMVEVRWSAANKDDPQFIDPLVGDWITLLGPYMGSKGCYAAGECTRTYFDDENWDEAFGPEATDVHVLVDIHGPPNIAGRYSVNLQRITQAQHVEKVETA